MTAATSWVIGDSLVLTPAADFADRPPADAVFLGRIEDGRHVWAGPVADFPGSGRPGGPRRGPRRAGMRFDDVGAQLVTCALALLNWHDTARFSPSDGSPTRPIRSGWARRNILTGHEEFPVDPAVICLVHDGHDRAVLARRWPAAALFSLIAGFVEAGESFIESPLGAVWCARSPGRSG